MVAMAESKPSRVVPKLHKWRMWVQAGFLLVWLDPLVLRLHWICGPVFHCYSCPLATFACPIGVMANFSALHVLPLLAVGTVLAVGALLGSIVCGWVCPFGFLQDLLGRVPAPKVNLPAWSGHFRYVVLGGLVAAIPFLAGESHPLFICRVCPAGALEAAVPTMARTALAGGEVLWPNAVKVIVTVLIVTGAFFTWRPWCRLFCPLGAVYGLLNRASLVMLRRRSDRCDGCGLCGSPCRYGVVPARQLNGPRCIRCLECTQCGAIALDTPLGRRRSPDAGAGAPTGMPAELKEDKTS